MGHDEWFKLRVSEWPKHLQCAELKILLLRGTILSIGKEAVLLQLVAQKANNISVAVDLGPMLAVGYLLPVSLLPS